jgi:hypothetical protein
MSEFSRDLEAFLAQQPGEPASDAFRARLLCETEALVPHRRSPWRVVACAAAPCGLLVAFVLAWWMWRSHAQRPMMPALVDGEGPQAMNIAALPELVETETPSALALEWQAFDGESKDRAQLYWSAGQAYASSEGDLLSALRCYRQALDAGPAELRNVTDDDDALAMLLKFDRSHQEKKHGMP